MGLKSRFGPFWNELRRRKVVRAGGVYAVSAFVALQLGEIVLPAFNTPDWALQSLVVAAALGLPVVLAVAWAYELTSEGLRRTRDAPGAPLGQEAGPSLAPRLALLAVTTVSVAFAAVWFSRNFVSIDDGEGAGGWRSLSWAARQSDRGPGSPDRPDLRSAPAFANFDPEAPVSAIAVLPLANFAEGADDLFARQLHDEIINQLTRTTSLRVVSRTSVARYADTSAPLPRIARELRVQAVVTGSVAMTGESDSVRISIQLLHAPSDTHLMTRSYQREMRDILRLQTEIAQEIAQAVQGEVEEGAPARSVEHVATVDPEAHQAYLQGWEELDLDHELDLEAENAPDLEGENAQDLERGVALDAAAVEAMRHFSEAVGIDSTFGLAWLGRAEAGLVMLAHAGTSLPEEVPSGMADARDGSLPDELRPGESIVRIRESLRRAETLGAPRWKLDASRIMLLNVAKALDPDLAEDVEAALAEAGIATDSLAQAYARNSTEIGRRVDRSLADWSGRNGDGRPARSSMEDRAMVRRHFVAKRLLDTGQYDRAAVAYRRLIETDPTDEALWLVLEDVHLLRDDYAGAVKVREEHLLATQPDTPERAERIRELREAFDQTDHSSYWRLRLREAEARLARGDRVPHTVRAFTAVGLGDADLAFGHLEEAIAQREGFLGMSLDSPIWDPIRGDPRFGRVVRQIWRPRAQGPTGD